MDADRHLLDLQIETLFRLDGTGRLLATNDAARGPAPRFFLGRTRAGNVARYRDDLPDEVVAALGRLVAAEPVTGELTGEPPIGAAAMRAALGRHAPIGVEWRGPAYRFPEVPVPNAAATAIPVVAIAADNADLLAGAFAPWRPTLPAIRPCVAAVVRGEVVAVCHAARRSAAAAEAGVETLPAFRGRGYGAATVAAWAIAVRRAGLTPLYSTAWQNTASRRLAARLGLVLYAEDFHLG